VLAKFSWKYETCCLSTWFSLVKVVFWPYKYAWLFLRSLMTWFCSSISCSSSSW
jgi:hypothetical protein